MAKPALTLPSTLSCRGKLCEQEDVNAAGGGTIGILVQTRKNVSLI